MEENLYIPQGIKTNREYFEGFGNHELICLIISITVTGGIAYIGYLLFLNLFLAILLVMVIPTTVVFLTMKTGDMNISVWEEMKLLIKFQKSQKYYPYKALNEWETK